MQRSNQLLRRFLYQSKRSFTQTNKPETNNSPKIVEEASKGNNNDNNTNSNNGDGKGEVPKYNPIEYELFKFPHERDSLMHGYTLQELYGKKYGLKHSPAIKHEISKDNIMIVIAVVFSFTLAILSRNKDHEDEKAWLEYYYHDMSYVRENDK